MCQQSRQGEFEQVSCSLTACSGISFRNLVLCNLKDDFPTLSFLFFSHFNEKFSNRSKLS